MRWLAADPAAPAVRLALSVRLAAILALAAMLGLAETARAQVEATPPPAKTPVTSRLERPSEERDRFEIGAAVPEGYFDVLGTFGYRRLMYESHIFEQSMQLELTGGIKDYLSEGSFSVYYFLRPLASYRPEWRVRPLLEFGPGLHIAVQSADIEGFSESAFHAKGYFKTHAYAGAEFLLSPGFGFLVRGRLSVPAHRPLDYAQAAIFLR